MNPDTLQPGEIDRHLRTMRLATVGFLLTIPAAVIAMLLVPVREGVVPPMAMSLVAGATALWIGFTANRDAHARLERVKREFAVKGHVQNLLRNLRLVNLAVLARLEVMVVAAVVAAIWGGSSTVAWGVLVLAGMMMGLSWPTADKTHMLIQRAREQRGR